MSSPSDSRSSPPGGIDLPAVLDRLPVLMSRALATARDSDSPAQWFASTSELARMLAAIQEQVAADRCQAALAVAEQDGVNATGLAALSGLSRARCHQLLAAGRKQRGR